MNVSGLDLGSGGDVHGLEDTGGSESLDFRLTVVDGGLEGGVVPNRLAIEGSFVGEGIDVGGDLLAGLNHSSNIDVTISGLNCSTICCRSYGSSNIEISRGELKCDAL